jgi:hypothetical protein
LGEKPVANFRSMVFADTDGAAPARMQHTIPIIVLTIIKAFFTGTSSL